MIKNFSHIQKNCSKFQLYRNINHTTCLFVHCKQPTLSSNNTNFLCLSCCVSHLRRWHSCCFAVWRISFFRLSRSHPNDFFIALLPRLCIIVLLSFWLKISLSICFWRSTNYCIKGKFFAALGSFVDWASVWMLSLSM